MSVEKFELHVKTHFDAAHYIKDYVGKCGREHGHRWEVEAVLEGSRLDKRNMLVDFAQVKKAMNGLIDTMLDHQQLNEQFAEPNVTAEFLARYVYGQLRSSLCEIREGLRLVRTCIWESPDCCVKYYQEGGDEC